MEGGVTEQAKHETTVEPINQRGSFRLVCSCGHRDWFGTPVGQTADDTRERAGMFAARHVEEKS